MKQQSRVGEQFSSYRLIKLLGRGGFAEVYLGRHTLLNSYAAVKIAHNYLLPEQFDLLRQEAQSILDLDHPCIVRLLQFDLQGNLPFLVMQYAPGGSLRQRYPKGTRLPIEQVVSYIEQIAEPLQYAHDHNLIHRDIKPDNILIGQIGELLLSDFGVAVISHHTHSLGLPIALSGVAGTVRYMAPEQYEGHTRRASDQYALALTAYEWLNGEYPFEDARRHLFVLPPSLRDVQGVAIPETTEKVIMRALANDADKRFPSVQAFAEALRESITPSRPVPRRRMLIGVGIAAFATVVGVPLTYLVSSLWGWWGKGPSAQGAGSGFPPAAKPTATPTLLPTPIGWMYGNSSLRAQPSAKKPFIPRKTAPQKPLWTFPGDFSNSSPTIAGNTIYIGSNDGHLYAIDAQHGNKLWAYNANSPIASSPAVVEGTVYFGTEDGFFHAVNIANQQLRWSPFSTTSNIAGFPAVVKGVVYFGSADFYLYALNASDGTPLWKFKTQGAIISSPAVVNDIVYIGSGDGNLYAHDALKGGPPLWTFSPQNTTDLATKRINSSPAVASACVYIGSESGVIYAVHVKDGTLRWSHSTGKNVSSSPVVVGNTVYIGSEDGYLYALAANDGTPLWSFSTAFRAPIYGTPAIADEVLYLGSDNVAAHNGNLYAIDIANQGKTLWSYLVGEINSSPAVANNIVYIASSWDNMLYAFSAL